MSRPLSQSQFPGLRWVSRNEPSDDGPIWSAFWRGLFVMADSERGLLSALLETAPTMEPAL